MGHDAGVGHRPVNAILIQSGWSVFLLLFWGTFENVIEYVTFMDWIGLGMVGTAIFVFRRKYPQAERGYRTWGYPVTPLIFVGSVGLFLVFTLVGRPIQAGAGLMVAVVGWLAYWFYFKKK